MNFLIISHVSHMNNKDSYYAYGPYVKEMNLWLQNVDSIQVVAPLKNSSITAIDFPYSHSNINLQPVSEFSLTSPFEVAKTFLITPKNIWEIFKAMKKADHIHLRCPGNMGLLGCIVQIFFPSKPKTAKYAGNWDPNSKQPWTYRLQKWILRNTFLTKNIQVLVYGKWENQSKNIKPFFTATYTEADKESFNFANESRSEELKAGTIRFLFVGTLSAGKRPLYAVQLVEQLHKNGHKVLMELFGEGTERELLEAYIKDNQLSEIVKLRGNHKAETVKIAYQQSHFLILPSKSEGWPKAVAEAMFWGCVPLATAVSCVPQMLGFRKRGLLLTLNMENDLQQLRELIHDKVRYTSKSEDARKWSQQYTLDYFEEEIKNLLTKSNNKQKDAHTAIDR